MASGKATFRVFISSPFSKLEETPNSYRRVCHELPKLAADHSRKFQAIDLR